MAATTERRDQEVQSTALTTSLAEIDLGEFRTTLPRDPNTHIHVVELHIFGTVPRSRLSEVKKQIKADGYRVRHEMLAAVRRGTVMSFAEPNLALRRNRIEKVVNDMLADPR